MLDFNKIKKLEKKQIVQKAINLHIQGNIQEAVNVYEYLINQGLNDPLVFSNYGLILKNHGRLKDAERFLRKAVKINNNFANAHYNLGLTLSSLGRESEAFNCLNKANEIDPSTPNINLSLVDLISNSDISKFNRQNLEKTLNILMNKEDIPHQFLFDAINKFYKNYFSQELFEKELSNLIINNKLIISALKKMIFRDPTWEIILTKCRRNFLLKVKHKNSLSIEELTFLIALSQQCFLNDYVFSLTKDEETYIDKLIKKYDQKYIEESEISIISCYVPLYKLLKKIPNLNSFNSNIQPFEDLIRMQLKNPLLEIKLSKDIRKIGFINNKISQIVKSQYEQDPYPKWVVGSKLRLSKTSFTNVVNNEIKPNFIKSVDGELNCLIAGCGTGQHILNVSKYSNVKITGIDLSLSSLSYTKRKIIELNIDNVELVLIDILNLHLLKKNFDIVESIGVLHHMENPYLGCESLLNNLKQKGLLKLGLYSEYGRQDLIKVREYKQSCKSEIDDKFIREFRQKVLTRELPFSKVLIERPDFYTLSDCRDLCFHSKEHRFNIKEIEKMIKTFGLCFLGFELPQSVKNLYKKNFSQDKHQTNLSNWSLIEERYPTIFKSMYRFWVSKI